MLVVENISAGTYTLLKIYTILEYERSFYNILYICTNSWNVTTESGKFGNFTKYARSTWVIPEKFRRLRNIFEYFWMIH